MWQNLAAALAAVNRSQARRRQGKGVFGTEHRGDATLDRPWLVDCHDNGTVHDYDREGPWRQVEDRVTTVGSGIAPAVQRVATAFDVRGLQQSTKCVSSPTVGSGTVLNEVQMAYNDFAQLTHLYLAHDGMVNVSTSPKIASTYASGVGTSNQIRPTSVAYPGGRKIDFGYGATGGLNDKLSRVQTLQDGATTLAEYSYLGTALAVQTNYPEPNVLLDLWGGTPGVYDGLDRFGRIIDLPWIQNPSGTPTKLVHLKYGYNRASSPTYARDEVARTASAGLDQRYSHDGLQRLVDFQQGTLASNNASIGSATLTQGWDLDPVGNWDGFNQGVSGVLNQTRTFNRVNEITDITNAGGQPLWIDPVYDDAGNTMLTPRPADPTAGFTLTYDAWNFPVEVQTSGGSPKTVAKYAHNGLRHRIRKEVYNSAGALSSTTLYFNNSAWQCLESRETPVAGSPATTTYVWGVRYIDDLVCRDRGSVRLYTMQDRQYKTMAIANASGAVQERYGYTPYGVTTVYSPTYSVRSGSSFDWTYLYTGRELDWETNLYYFRNRMYDPVLGRFLTRDPTRYQDGLSLYQGYFSCTSLDPVGLATTTGDSHSGFDPAWLESSGCYDFCIASGHSPGRCHDFCNYDNPPSSWPIDPPQPTWPIAWGNEIPHQGTFPLPEWNTESNDQCCRCTWDRSGHIYPGYNIERPTGIDGRPSQPGFTTAPCQVGDVVIMRYRGTCEKRVGGKTCECESSCSVFRLWECRQSRSSTIRTPGGTMWAQAANDHYSGCS